MHIKSFVLIFLILLVGGELKAQLVLGSQVDYEYLDSFKYEVRLIVYTDCRDSSFQLDSNSTFKISTSGVNGTNLSPTLVQIKNISNYHDTISSCASSDTLFGVEEYTFLDTVDFNSTYSSIKNSTHIYFLFATNKRAIGDAISVSGTTRNSLNYALLKLQSNFQSRKFASSPLFIQNKYVPFYTNHLSKINNGRDSVEYSYGNLLESWGQSITINPGNPGYPPIPVYYPGSLTPPYQNPNSNPPIGLYFDKETSEFIGTPNTNGLYDYVIEAEVWGYNSVGQRIVAGEMRRDVMMKIKTGSDNNPAIIDGPYYYTVCEGNEICFHLTTSDAVFVPPPPAATPAPDTVEVTWDGALAHQGAVFSIFDSTSRVQTGLFCWMTPENSSSDVPYAFSVIAKDNHSISNSVSKRTFRIRVKQTARTLTRSFEAKSCGDFQGIKTQIDVDTSFEGTPSVRLEILDTNLTIIDSTTKLYFNSTGTFLSFQQNDFIVGDTSGKYVIQTTMKNLPQNCPTRYYDTIVLTARPTEDGFWPTETVFCDVDQDTLKLEGTWGSFIWNTGDTTSYLEVSTEGYYSVLATDTCGNQLKFFTYVLIETSPYDNIQDTFMCIGDSVLLTYVDANPFNISWSDNSTNQSFVARDTGTYFYEVSKKCGVLNGSFTIFDNAPSSKLFADSTICDEITYSYLHLNKGQNQVYWQNDTLLSDSIYVSYMNEVITLTTSNECGSDTISLELKPIIRPSISIPDTLQFCLGDSLAIVAQGNHPDNWLWSNGSTDSSIRVYLPGNYWVTNAVFCGSSSDSVVVTMDSIPSAQLMSDTVLCDGDSLELRSLTNSESASILWNTGSVDSNLMVHKAGIYILTLTNICGSSVDSVLIDSLGIPEVFLGSDSIIELPFSITLDAGDAEDYLWSTGETSSSILVSDSGCYWVEVSNSCGSTSDTICFSDTFSPINVPHLMRLGIVVYPNPSYGSITIESKNTIINQVKIYNVLGEEVFNETFHLKSIDMDVTQLINGTYFVQLNLGNEQVWTKVVVKH